jgi:hypothetical protein
MPRGSPAVKLAITVDPDVHAKVLRAARRDHVSVSAWMTDAARRLLRIQDGLEAVAEWEAQHGRFTAQELDEARERVRDKHADGRTLRRSRNR